MGKLDGKTAFITGIARGQGRSHALRLAEEGANIIGVDICSDIEAIPYPLATKEDLETTVKAVESRGRRVFAAVADVRDEAGLARALAEGVDAIGPVDIVLANAGVLPMALNQPHDAWQVCIDVNLTGVFNTIETVIPSMIDRGQGGSIVITSSTAGLKGVSGPSRGGMAYVASKHAVVGLMRSYARDLAPHWIRVNTVHPTGIATPMVTSDAFQEFWLKDPSFPKTSKALPIDMVEEIDVSHAIAWLVSDEARYITGVTLPVDGGFNVVN
ncbi:MULTISPECIES: mycofactocin-coupled SDR family oxidoreductase [unclassified Rhodococcus (in: high G+C Gram-positive bacteria)]|uniref:mycofactocin-coupled SDR family oxidoreductase n=1 Tax=unclassified Rhodococcus (in: high G+C Gram-positive bacteria) TaxID=192944 RepID=UPI00163A3E30|nr:MULTISPECIES: mycofactocin-coupled SDR family oxidoreductase [unclassified Rhodococcus (in: high G+C Gram-positive bacteria)]MBC2640898.1 mycofactocin-coupled SDR family oxidoreductase [Rhodococcus sp. 3A]MBC2894358.1 mycofactocin-coupled SDR family oxidoreductase [Rhodococcus sp. 4CII]